MYPVVLPVLAGFGRGRGCIDHIFTLRNIIEQSTEWQRTLCELCRFYQDFRQHTPAQPLEDITSVWNPLPTYWDHEKLVWQLYGLCWWWWHLIWSPHWCQTGLCHVHIAFQPCSGLDHAAHRWESDQGHQMDTLFLLGRPGLRWWSSLTITHPHAHSREDTTP